MVSDEVLQEIIDLEQDLSSKKWVADKPEGSTGWWDVRDKKGWPNVATCWTTQNADKDAHFIVLTRNNVANMAAEILSLRHETKKAQFGPFAFLLDIFK